MSSSDPIRRAGMRFATSSEWSRAARFMSDLNAPGAIAVTLMLSLISFVAIRRVKWITAALLAA